MNEHDSKCCYIYEGGLRCDEDSSYWVGLNGIDNYTYSCDYHLQETRKLFAPNGMAIQLKLLGG